MQGQNEHSFFVRQGDLIVKISRRAFLAGTAAATVAVAVPRGRANAAVPKHGTVATLIDLTHCDGCPDFATPKCVDSCRIKNADRFPEPDPAMLKDYWPKKFHEDWSDKRDITSRLTPYNWTFIDRVSVELDGKKQELTIPRRCMHCETPSCVTLCPFGSAKQEANGVIYIDSEQCFGGAKCRKVCPWDVPQRQAGVGPYTMLDPMPVGGGAMFKCDLCRDLLATGQEPACVTSCPKNAIQIGLKDEIVARAEQLAEEYGGYLYGRDEHGGTNTIYISKVPFEEIDRAILAKAKDPKKALRFNDPENQGNKQHGFSKAALIAPLAGVAAAFVATATATNNKGDDDE